MADDIRALSAALARDPSSLQYVELAEALRRKGKLAESVQVAMHGLGRHPEHADGYDCLARIHTDRGELAEARAAWERVLAIVPEHPGALKGIGFLFFRQGDTRKAVEALEHALAVNPGDESTRRALTVLRGDTDLQAAGSGDRGTDHARVSRETRSRVSARAAEPELTADKVPQLRATAATIPAVKDAESAFDRAAADARDAALGKGGTAPPQPRTTTARQVSEGAEATGRPPVFAGLEGATADMLLLDAHGLVMAGGLKAADGTDASEIAAAALAGVSGEATRTAGYLKLGQWTTIVAEAERANVVLAPVGDGALLMLRRDKSTPVGLALRIAERARRAASTWLEDHSA